MSRQEEEIYELCSQVKCRLAPSKIHGVGVFTIRDIKKDEKLYCIPQRVERKFYNLPYASLTKLYPEVRSLILERWPSIINGSHFLSPNDDAWLILFMNHSNEPNYAAADDMALRDIKVGEEVLEDYRLMTNWEKVYPWIDTKDMV